MITVTRDAYMAIKDSNPAETLNDLEKIIGWYNEISGLDGTSDLNMPSALRIHYIQDTVTPSKELENVFMYATDYLVGMPADSASDLLSNEKRKYAWSIWHETGHKYQQHDWTWDEVTETTVNIYSLYAQGQWGFPSRLNDKFEADNQTAWQMAKLYLAKAKRSFTNDKLMGEEANWIRLVMFEQLRQHFGDQFYPNLHKYYRENQLGEKKTLSKDAKIQNFILHASMIAKVNLAGYFEDWGIQPTRQTQDKLKQLKLPVADPSLSRLGMK